MSLEVVADKFIELSGRNDLIPGSGQALDAYWYINQAQRMLDRYLSDGKAGARYAVDISVGQILVPIYGCRAVKKVFVSDASERSELNKIDIQVLRSNYPKPKASLTSGIPLYYAPVWARPYPAAQVSGDVTYTWVLEEILDASKRNAYNALLLMPPADMTYTLDIWGLWYTETLSLEESISYWTEEHEDILLNAAMYKLEVQYRNTEGAKDWKNAVDMDIAEIIKDQIEEETSEINQMRG